MTDTTAADAAAKAAQVEREARRLERIRRLKVIDGGREPTHAPSGSEPGPKAAA